MRSPLVILLSLASLRFGYAQEPSGPEMPTSVGPSSRAIDMEPSPRPTASQMVPESMPIDVLSPALLTSASEEPSPTPSFSPLQGDTGSPETSSSPPEMSSPIPSLPPAPPVQPSSPPQAAEIGVSTIVPTNGPAAPAEPTQAFLPVAESSIPPEGSVGGTSAGETPVEAAAATETTFVGGTTVGGTAVAGSAEETTVAETPVEAAVTTETTVIGGTTVGGTTVAGTTVEATVVGGTTVAQSVVGGTTVDGSVVGGSTVAETVVGGSTIAGTTVEASVVGGTVIGGTTVTTTNTAVATSHVPSATGTTTSPSPTNTATFVPNLHFNWTFDASAAWHFWYPNNSASAPGDWQFSFDNQPANPSPGSTLPRDEDVKLSTGPATAQADAGNANKFGTYFQGTGVYISGTMANTSVSQNITKAPLRVTALDKVDSTRDNILDLAGDYSAGFVYSHDAWQVKCEMPQSPDSDRRAYVGVVDVDSLFTSGNSAAGSSQGDITVEGFTYTLGIKSEAPAIDAVPSTTEHALDGKLAVNPVFSFPDSWETVKSSTEPYPFMYGSGGNVTIDIPANTTLLLLNGTVGPTMGAFYAAFDPEPPAAYTPSMLSSRPMSAYNPMYAPAPLVLQTLDPAVKYTLDVVTTDLPSVPGFPKGSGPIGVHSVTFYSGVGTTDDPGPSSKSTIIGAIIGGVIGGILLIAAMIWLLRRRRSRARADPVHRASQHDFTIDVDSSLRHAPALLKRRAHYIPWSHNRGNASTTTASTSTSSTDSSSSGSLEKIDPESKDPPPRARRGRRTLRDLVWPRRPGRYRQEEDGGAVPASRESVPPPDTDVELIPPTYNPAWSASRAPTPPTIYTEPLDRSTTPPPPLTPLSSISSIPDDRLSRPDDRLSRML